LFSLVQFTFEKRCLNIPAPYNSAGIGFEDLTTKKKKEKVSVQGHFFQSTCMGYTGTGS
jgi:hypothetical protein